MRPAVLLVAVIVASVAGCGESYQIPRAQFVIADTGGTSILRVLDAIKGLLSVEGFDDLGTDDEMIDLLRHSGGSAQLIALYEHRYTYLNKARKLTVEVTDYTDPLGLVPSVSYAKPAGPFIDITVLEERPGGFSEAGHRFLDSLQTNLQNSLGRPVMLITPPPPDDDAEYRRITRSNTAALLVSWLLVIGVTLAITGPLFVYLLNRIAVPLSVKRSMFALINTWLVTPLPFPVAFIATIPLPNLLAFPWTDLDYYHRIRDFAVVSFPSALFVCTLVAVLSLRGRVAQMGDA